VKSDAAETAQQTRALIYGAPPVPFSHASELLTIKKPSLQDEQRKAGIGPAKTDRRRAFFRRRWHDGNVPGAAGRKAAGLCDSSVMRKQHQGRYCVSLRASKHHPVVGRDASLTA